MPDEDINSPADGEEQNLKESLPAEEGSAIPVSDSQDAPVIIPVEPEISVPQQPLAETSQPIPEQTQQEPEQVPAPAPTTEEPARPRTAPPQDMPQTSTLLEQAQKSMEEPPDKTDPAVTVVNFRDTELEAQEKMAGPKNQMEELEKEAKDLVDKVKDALPFLKKKE